MLHYWIKNVTCKPIFNSTGNAHYRIINSPIEHGIRSTLIIRQALQTDFGPYTCSLKNSHGYSSFDIRLEEQRKDFGFFSKRRPFFHLNVDGKFSICGFLQNHFHFNLSSSPSWLSSLLWWFWQSESSCTGIATLSELKRLFRLERNVSKCQLFSTLSFDLSGKRQSSV